MMFSGKKLFELKDTHGLPLMISLDRIINEQKLAVNWPEYIETAREHGRWDYQTLSEIQEGLYDAEVPHEIVEGIIDRFKLWVLKYPHPAMAS